MHRLNVLTGATGLLGSHIAEQLTARGETVRAVVRPGSDTAFLRQLGAELVPANLNDHEEVRRAIAGSDVVYHCAAKVGDWAPWAEFQHGIIDATENLARACGAEGVGRLLHVSSVQVYGHPVTEGRCISEDEPLGQRVGSREYYCRAKIAAEEMVRKHFPEATIIRPSWIFGPRDRNTIPRVINALRAGRTSLLRDGSQMLNIVYAGDVAEGAILAANHPNARGQAYNLTSPGEITQKELLDWLTGALGLPPIRRGVSYPMAYGLAVFSEIVGWLIRIKRSPYVTRYALQLISRSTRYSIEKARTQLGWDLRVPVREGLRRTFEWYTSQHEPLAAGTS